MSNKHSNKSSIPIKKTNNNQLEEDNTVSSNKSNKTNLQNKSMATIEKGGDSSVSPKQSYSNMNLTTGSSPSILIENQPMEVID